jgi:hypothetical protein
MPSSRSLYRKIHIILQVAQVADHRSLPELRDAVRQDGSPSFVTARYDADIDDFVEDLSDRSIGRAVTICANLGLLNDEGGLTSAGRRALTRRRFDLVLAEQVGDFLAQHGVEVDDLNATITRGLNSQPVALPTARHLWESSGKTIRYGTFAAMLNLLSAAGGARDTRGKLYLEFL